MSKTFLIRSKITLSLLFLLACDHVLANRTKEERREVKRLAAAWAEQEEKENAKEKIQQEARRAIEPDLLVKAEQVMANHEFNFEEKIEKAAKKKDKKLEAIAKKRDDGKISRSEFTAQAKKCVEEYEEEVRNIKIEAGTDMLVEGLNTADDYISKMPLPKNAN